MGCVTPAIGGTVGRWFCWNAGHHRLYRQHAARHTDHPGPQRQRLFGLGVRLFARRQRHTHLDRCRRRAVSRPPSRAQRAGHRFAVLQRGHGTGLFRCQSHPSADHGASHRPQHPDLYPQHVQPGWPGHLDLRNARLAFAGQGHHHHRRHCAGQYRGCRHDRRARYRAPAIRGTARRGHLSHSDLSGQLRAFHLLRYSAGPSRARLARRACRVPPGIGRGANPKR